jgi:HSP20 family molecular chaperone IbpA
MFFTAAAPATLRRHMYSPAGRSLERFLEEALVSNRQKAAAVEQDDKSFTLSFDVPGIGKEHLSIGIEGSVVRIETREGAPRQYKSAYELPLDIDVASSEAKLENGVLTLKLVKVVPVSKVSELVIN